MPTDVEIADGQIQKGMKLLDDGAEDDWIDRIDEEKLDLYSICNCVLGQTFGDFGEALEELGISYAKAVEFGFSIDGDNEASWDLLLSRWVKAIGARKGLA